MGDSTREKWNTEKMREHRNDWSLAADIQLFSYMQQFSQNLVSETHSTLKVLDCLESEVATTCVEVSNIGNRFWALSDTQFVENRVYDDDDVTSPVPASKQENPPEDDAEAVVIQRLKRAIQNGIQVLDSKFETVQVPASDSDEEDSSPHSGVILKPVNRYKDRPLPHLIGSAEFRTDDTLGLRDAPSDEETDDFMSASDKANDSESVGESEDSDIESDQTKDQHVLPHKPNDNDFSPLSLRIPGIENAQGNSVIPSPPPGEMFGEQEDDLFTQMAKKKPMFSSWQPSDLWAPEDDEPKHPVDDSGINRPPSVASSVSSAQSSNVSEPVKKTSEDFGKSGTGRQPVFVQDQEEDQDDLFGTKPSAASLPQTKEFVPAGGVKIFGGDFNPFRGRNLSKDNQNEGPASVTEQKRSENNDNDNDIFNKTQNVPTKVLPKVPTSSVFTKKKELSLFDDDEDLFSNRSTDSLGRSQHPSSVSSQDISVSDGTRKIHSEDDDLFSDSSNYFGSKTQLSHSIFSDDLFGGESDNLFSENSRSKQEVKIEGGPISKKTSDNLFSENKQLNKQTDAAQVNVSASSSKTHSIFDKDIFSDEADLFGNVTNTKSDDFFGPSSLSKTTSHLSKNKEQPKTSTVAKTFTKDLFDESEDEGLFSSTSKISKTQQKQAIQHDVLFGGKKNSSVTTGKQKVMEGSDLFSSKAPTEIQNPSVKGKPSVLKPRRGLERHSLFDSDSDDDLFSSPQGSLSSRKSVQSASAPTDSTDREDKKKLSSLHKESVSPRLPKTNFSSIFSNDDDDSTIFPIGNKRNDTFEEDKDLFSSSIVNVKTPDLFQPLLSKKIVTESSKDRDHVTQKPEYRKEVETKMESKRSEAEVEARKKSLTDPSSKAEEVVAIKTDIFDDSSSASEVVLPVSKKPKPPKSLDIKPISESLSSILLETEDHNVSKNNQKPPAASSEPLFKVSVEKSVPKDTTDGEVISPPSPSKPVPGKLKASQLININTAALLPGARPQLKIEQSSSPEQMETITTSTSSTSVSSRTVPSEPFFTPQTVMSEPFFTPHTGTSEPFFTPHTGTSEPSLTPNTGTSEPSLILHTDTSEPTLTHPTVNSDSSITPRIDFSESSLPPPTLKSEPSESLFTPLTKSSEPLLTPHPFSSVSTVTSHTIGSITSISTQEEDMPPKSSPLQNINKERVKIQGKRRPSSRRARQEAIRASSIEGENNAFILPPSSSTLMSPSTDEEDLFGVPPLDVIYDVKTVSPSTDIFGTPTVLSPVTNKELPSSFVSTPFVHSQPPPLDEEQEEGSNQDDDLFESPSNLLGSLTKEKKSVEVKSEVQSKKVDFNEDIFGEAEDDGLFQGIREAPPPLVDDDDEDDYDELFMTRKKKENASSSKSHSGSVIAVLESLPREDSLFSQPAEFTKPASGHASSLLPKNKELEDGSLFSSGSLIKPVSDDSLFSTSVEPSQASADEFLFNKSVEHSTANSTLVTEKNPFSFDSSNKKLPDSSVPVVSDLVKETNKDSLFVKSAGSDDEDSLFARSVNPTKISSSELFGPPVETLPKTSAGESLANPQRDGETNSDDELFGSHIKSSKISSDRSLSSSSISRPLESGKSKSDQKIQEKKHTKKETLFDEDEEEESGNLFLSVTEKKIKAKQPAKSSLFGDENDGDDDIFGSSLLSKKTEPDSASEAVKGSLQKSTKSANPGSSRPVKLETKQTFSDPLLSHQDKD